LVLVTLGGLGVEAGAPQGPAPQTLPTFKSSVELVPISAIVRDHRGRLITSLSAADFEVIDKGEHRSIIDFHVDDSSPISLAFLVDVSGSMRLGPKLAYAREVFSQLIGKLKDGRDEAGLFTFDATLHEQHSFTSHPSTIEPAFSRTNPWGTTSLYDAIAATARQLATRPSPRQAIVVLTDGVDTSSQLTPEEVSSIASAIDLPVYIVATVPPIDQAEYLRREAGRAIETRADLRELALWTGGDLLWVTTPEDAVAGADEILALLRHQYLIAIESAGGSEWRPLDIHTRNPRFVVRARSGYFTR
jgi:VWFA-related protein